jgi:hypothetical protein
MPPASQGGGPLRAQVSRRVGRVLAGLLRLLERGVSLPSLPAGKEKAAEKDFGTGGATKCAASRYASSRKAMRRSGVDISMLPLQ